MFAVVKDAQAELLQRVLQLVTLVVELGIAFVLVFVPEILGGVPDLCWMSQSNLHRKKTSDEHKTWLEPVYSQFQDKIGAR